MPFRVCVCVYVHLRKLLLPSVQFHIVILFFNLRYQHVTISLSILQKHSNGYIIFPYMFRAKFI